MTRLLHNLAEPCPCEPLPPARIGWRETVGSGLFLAAVFFVAVML